jgi:hypothetical protein
MTAHQLNKLLTKKTEAQIKEGEQIQFEFWNINVMCISMFGVRFVKNLNIGEIYNTIDKKQGTTWLDDFLKKKGY